MRQASGNLEEKDEESPRHSELEPVVGPHQRVGFGPAALLRQRSQESAVWRE